MKRNSNYLSFVIFLVSFFFFIYVVPSNGELLNKETLHEAEDKYLLATDLMEQAFGEVDAYMHLVSDEVAFAIAIENFIAACNLNYAKACTEIGFYYANGQDLLRKDNQKAIRFLEKALSLGDYSQAISLLYSYYSSKYYDKTIYLAEILLNSGRLKSKRDENSVFYLLESLYSEENTTFLNYTKAYACCIILSKTDKRSTTTRCTQYISNLSPNEIKNAKQIINKWMTAKIWKD